MPLIVTIFFILIIIVMVFIGKRNYTRLTELSKLLPTEKLLYYEEGVKVKSKCLLAQTSVSYSHDNFVQNSR